MNENGTAMPTDGAEETTDAFLSGFDGTEMPQESETPSTEPETGSKAESAPAESGEGKPDVAEKPADPENATPTGENPAEPEHPDAAEDHKEPAVIRYKYMDKEETVAADSPEAVALVQKGRDYDRVRQKYDESKPVMETVSLLAKQMGTSVPEILSTIRLNLKTKDGMTEDEAKRAIAMEDREAVISAKEAEKTEQERREQERQTQITAFANKYPKLDAKEIPKEVWTQFNDGTPLIDAYEKYQSQKQISEKDRRLSELEAELAALKKNAENSTKSSGSMKSAGNDAVERDAFLEGFGS